MRLSEEQFTRFANLVEEKATNKQIRQLLGVSSSVATRLLQFYKFHGRAESYAYMVEGIRVQYTAEELRSIAERLSIEHIPADRGSTMYKLADYKKLAKLLKERKATGLPLGEPAPLPVFSGIQNAQDTGSPAGESGLAGDAIISRTFGMPAESATPEPAHPTRPRFGKATAPVPSGRVAKKMRSKAQEAQRKEQERLQKQNSGKDFAKTPEAQGGTLGDLADEILGEFPAGIPAKEFVAGKGRQPEIDIHSEGFDDLPLEIRYRAMEIYNTKLEIWRAAVKKLRALVR